MRKMRMAVYPGKMYNSFYYDSYEAEKLRKKAKTLLDDLLQEKNKEKEDHILDGINLALDSLNKTEKCDIIDIAEKELEHIDTTEIDQECNSVMIPELMNKMVTQWIKYGKKLTEEEEQFLAKALNIQGITYKERYITFKHWNPMSVEDFSRTTELPEDVFLILPEVRGINERVIILLDRCQPPTQEAAYDEERLVEKLRELGLNDDCNEKEFESYIDYLISSALKQNSDIITDDTYIRCNIEEKVVAIGINKNISNPKETIANALKINPKLFIDVCGPGSTVLLIDTRRWALEEKESNEEDIWYQ